MATLSGQPHDAPKMWIECGVTLLERRGALLESRFYDQRVQYDFSNWQRWFLNCLIVSHMTELGSLLLNRVLWLSSVISVATPILIYAITIRAHFEYALGQWERVLHCNVASHGWAHEMILEQLVKLLICVKASSWLLRQLMYTTAGLFGHATSIAEQESWAVGTTHPLCSGLPHSFSETK